VGQAWESLESLSENKEMIVRAFSCNRWIEINLEGLENHEVHEAMEDDIADTEL
jgi:hypothetical protein